MFMHRFRFTGISAQIQPSEMFEHWRRSLKLEELFEDIKVELESASQMVVTFQQRAATERAEKLNQLAFAAVVLGLIVGALGMNIFYGTDQLLDGLGHVSELSKFFLTSGIVLLLVAMIGGSFSLKHSRNIATWSWLAMGGIGSIVVSFFI